ncbi:MAG: glycosyltransferase [Gammaproteobacteria bacterium]
MSDPIKVLCIANHGDTWNSVRPEAEIFVGAQKAGISVEMLIDRDSVYRPRLEEHGIVIHESFIKKKFDREAVRQLGALIDDRRIDILHMFNNPAIVTGLRAARGRKVKCVTYRGQTGNVNRFDPTCYLTHLHPRVDCITCVADSVRADLAQQLFNPAKAITIYKGHDLEWYRDAPADLAMFGIEPGEFVIGAVANLRPRKGLNFLIGAARYLPADCPIKILLVGSGTDSDAVREAIEPYPNRFALAGFRTDAPAIIAACQASVLAATKREGLPKTVVESMAYGVTPIVTSTGGSPELVEDGVSGLVVPPSNSEAIAHAMLELWRNPEQNLAMGQRARQRIDTHFNKKDTVSAHVTLYHRLMGLAVPRAAAS